MRPLVSPKGQPQRAAPPRPSRGAAGSARRSEAGDHDRGGGREAVAARSVRARKGERGRDGARGVTVRRLARTIGDGFRCESAPGLRSVADAERLADEIAFSASRLALLEHDPPGLYAEVAAEGDLEERSWLCFLVAYLGPLEHDAPFAEIQRVRVPWRAAGELRLERPRLGPRTAHDPARASRTIDAYRAWAARSGSQAAAYTGEPGWSAERRFERVFERLALPGLHRAARFELLCSLGRLGVYELRAGTLALGGEDPVTLAAKRVLGIGDRLLLERRAAELARSCGVGLDALDLALFNWERGERARVGVDGDLPVDPGILAGVRAALELD